MVHLSCGVRVSRIILLVLNIIFMILGLTMLGFGIYLTASKKFDVAFFDDVNVQIIGGNAIQSVGITLIVVGLFTIIISAVGCLGALYNNKLFLYIYTIILVILMIAELAAFITALVLRVDIRDTYEKNLWNIFNDAYVKNRSDVEHAIEKLEAQFECCGVHSYEDYASVNRTIPPSCYRHPGTFQELYDTSCADAIIDWMWDELPKISGVVGAVLFLEIFGVIASISMVVAISHYSYGRIYHK